jgi:hypothetical protein
MDCDEAFDLDCRLVIKTSFIEFIAWFSTSEIVLS